MSGDKPKGRQGFHLDMPFEEALERYAGVAATEIDANIKKSKKKKPPGGIKKREPPGKKASADNVLSLKDRKTSLRRRGLA